VAGGWVVGARRLPPAACRLLASWAPGRPSAALAAPLPAVCAPAPAPQQGMFACPPTHPGQQAALAPGPLLHCARAPAPAPLHPLQYFKRPGAIRNLVEVVQACNATWPSELLVNVDDKQDAGGALGGRGGGGGGREGGHRPCDSILLHGGGGLRGPLQVRGALCTHSGRSPADAALQGPQRVHTARAPAAVLRREGGGGGGGAGMGEEPRPLLPGIGAGLPDRRRRSPHPARRTQPASPRNQVQPQH
jgi:hypothetical protein